MASPYIRRTASFAPLSAFLLASVAHATQTALQADQPASSARDNWAGAPASVRDGFVSSHDLGHDVLFQTSDDGAVWARGAGYKARFDGQGATIIPFLGSDAPANHPIVMHVSAVTSAGVPLTASEATAATRVDRNVRIGHGSFDEVYELASDGIEQTFVFDALPQRGELVLRMDVQTDLQGSDLGTTLRFENELGHVDYGAAFAIDAEGRRVALDSALVDGAIQLTVPADFVRQAALPLTIDPFITSYTVAGAAHTEGVPDVSYDATTDQWCIVWVDVWSVTDYDVFARFASSNFTLGMTNYTIDFTTDYWTTPRIANNRLAHEFMIVCAVVPAPVGSNPAGIRGKLLDAMTGSVGSQIYISAVDGAYRNFPDVGGDPNGPPFTSDQFCVVWQRPVSVAAVNIESQIVNTSGALQGSVVSLNGSVGYDEYPRISKSIGIEGVAQPYNWTVVWQRRVSTNNHDIWGCQVYWYGAAAGPPFPIDTSFQDDTFPAVSSMMDPLPTVDARPYMVVYQRAFTDTDIIASVMRGTSLVTNVDLANFYPAQYGNLNQTLASVDCDGSHFLVSFVEAEAFPSTDTNVWVSDYYLSGNSLVPCTDHQIFAGSPVAENRPSVCAMRSSGGSNQHFIAAWEYSSINNSTDIQGGLWDACVGGNVTAFCSGDGSGTACPCGNSGVADHGCANSTHPLGAQLVGTGSATVSNDTFTLNASGMGPSSPCLYFQGTIGIGNGSAFGDGLRCVTGTVVRLAVRTNNSMGASSYNAAPGSALHIQGGLPVHGGTRFYQVWCRDAAAFCTSSTFNLTNGLQVVWGW